MSARAEPTEYEIPLLYDPLLNPLPIVLVRVNGSEPLPFMVDTGTNVILMEPWAAEKTGLKTKPSPDPPGASPPVPEQSFDFGAVGKGFIWKVNGDGIAIKSLDLPSDFIGVRVAGIIGLPLLSQVTTRFDFKRKTLTVTFDPHPPLKLSGAACLPLEVQKDSDNLVKSLNVWVRANDLELLMKLDTSAQYTHLPKSAGPNLGRILTTAIVSESQGIGGWREEHEAVQIPVLRLGAQTLHNVYAMLAIRGASGRALLGMNILSRYRVTLDPRNRQLWLEPNGKENPSESADTPGVTGIALALKSDGKENAYFVSKDSALTSSAQAANIKQGDQILSVDGKTLAALPLLAARRFLNGFAGSEATIILTRDGKQITTILRRASPFLRTAGSGGSGIGFSVLPGVKEGLEVVGIAPLSPAENAGLKIGDLIIVVSGFPIPQITEQTVDHTMERVGKLLHAPISSEIVLTVKRVGEAQSRTVKLHPRQ